MWTPDRFESLKPTFRALRYRSARKRGIKPLVDIYVPEGVGPHPSVILIHGGAFIVGSRDMKPARFLASRLVKEGFVVASIDYRMVLRGGRFAESQEDVQTMIDWWFAHAATYNLDTNNVSMLGISAGAALMLMTASKAEVERFSSLVSVYGIYDFNNLSGGPLKFMRRRLFRSRDPNVWKAHSPLFSFTKSMPLLVIHGTADQIVPVAQADRLVQARQSEGLPVTYIRSNEAPHGFFNDARAPQSQQTLPRLIQFLKNPRRETS